MVVVALKPVGVTCEILGCPNLEEWGVSWEFAAGGRAWFRVCEHHAEELRGNHRGGGWYKLPLAERMGEP